MIAADFNFNLYDTSSIEASVDIPSADPPTWPHPLPTWTYKYPGCRGLSQPYCCGNTNEFRIIFSTRYALKGITIPCHSGESQPKTVTIMPLDIFYGEERCHFGYNSTVVIADVPPRKMFYYSWPEGSSESSLDPSNVVKFEEEWSSPEYSAFDECSGRVVVQAGNEDVIIYDFAKF